MPVEALDHVDQRQRGDGGGGEGLHLDAGAVDLTLGPESIEVVATVRTADHTGVEMEALTAASVAALALIDMVKGLDRNAYIREVKLLAKEGGRSGSWRRDA